MPALILHGNSVGDSMLTPGGVCRTLKATLDYVLYTRDSLSPVGLLELPAEGEVITKPGDSLPNANWSSDHVCLMSEFQILQHKAS